MTSDSSTPPVDRSQRQEPDATHMLAVFSVSAGMVGVCLTAIGLIQVFSRLSEVSTLCDELLVIDALLFLLACVSSYWALHNRLRRHYRRLRLAVDTLLMVGIVLMVVVCGLFAWEIA